MSLPLHAYVRVTAIREHIRTVSGRRDRITGAAITESVSLGWFIVTDLDDGGISFPVGPEMPKDIAVGDKLLLTLAKVGA